MDPDRRPTGNRFFAKGEPIRKRAGGLGDVRLLAGGCGERDGEAGKCPVSDVTLVSQSSR